MHATKQEIINFLKTEFAPSLKHCTIVEVGEKAATLIWHVTEKDLRPGNTVSGPTMMTLADFALYVAILAEIGIVGLAGLLIGIGVGYVARIEEEERKTQ